MTPIQLLIEKKRDALRLKHPDQPIAVLRWSEKEEIAETRRVQDRDLIQRNMLAEFYGHRFDDKTSADGVTYQVVVCTRCGEAMPFGLDNDDLRLRCNEHQIQRHNRVSARAVNENMNALMDATTLLTAPSVVEYKTDWHAPPGQFWIFRPLDF